MAQRERHALGTFFQSLGGSLEQSLEEKRRKRAEWLALIMSGKVTPQEAEEITGYDPSEEEVRGAESRQERMAGEAQQERIAEGLKEGEKYTSLTPQQIGELDVPFDVSGTMFGAGKPRVPVRRTDIDVALKLRPEEPEKTAEEKARAAGLREAAVQKARLPFEKPTVSEHAKRVQSEVDRFNADFRKEVIGRYMKLNKQQRREKRVELWQVWQESIDFGIREDVARKLKMPLEELIERATPEENIQKDIYNRCRDKGGTDEECRREAGVTINK